MRPGNAATGDAPGKTETRTGRNTGVPARAAAFPRAPADGVAGCGLRVTDIALSPSRAASHLRQGGRAPEHIMPSETETNTT